jgi:hypothetical protein
MDPFDKNDELSEQELDDLLKKWKTPGAPPHIRAAVFPRPQSWWRGFWKTSLRIPVPAAACLVLLAALFGWQASRSPRVIVTTKTVEVPVVTERVITQTVYRQRTVRAAAPVEDPGRERFQFVPELRPRIIPAGSEQNE